MHHQGVTMPWEEFKKRGVYKFKLDEPHVAFRDQIEKGMPFQTASGKIEIFSTMLGQITDWTKTQYGYEIPAIPKWIEPWEMPQQPEDEGTSVPSDHRRIRVTAPTRSSTTSAGCARPTSRKSRSTRPMPPDSASRPATRSRCSTIAARCVVPAYVTERCMPGVLCCTKAPGWISTTRAWIVRATPTS